MDLSSKIPDEYQELFQTTLQETIVNGPGAALEKAEELEKNAQTSGGD